MTREEAIYVLRREIEPIEGEWHPFEEVEEALNMAIEALNSVTESVNDAIRTENDVIKRRDAIKASWKALYDYQDEMETKFRESDDVEFGDWFIHRIFVQGVHGEILNRIVDIPSADAVEVVRCKDCKWWEDNIGYYSVSFCPWDEDIGVPDADDFCSFGERREDGGA